MEKRRLPALEADISLLGFGCMRFPTAAGGKEIDRNLTTAMVDRAVHGGVNYFDTAWPYHEGKSEQTIGRILSNYPRERYYLADKAPTWLITSPSEAEVFFTRQLARCQVEYFDFYLLHCLTESIYQRALQAGLYEVLRRKKDQGLIRQLGFSFHDGPGLFKRILDNHDWDFAQIQLNYVDWDILEAETLYLELEQRGIPAIIMEPVRGGALASLTPEALDVLRKADPEASPASWALRYAASLPGVLTVLSGMSDMEQVEDNLRTLSKFKPLSEDERKTIDKASTLYLASGVVPCTACRYCMDCPSGVDIPRVFALYNRYRATGNRMHFDIAYEVLGNGAQAHNCNGCSECAARCPQGIDVPDYLREVAALAATPSEKR